MTEFQRTAATFRQGSRTLPGERYTSPVILEQDRERVFAGAWNCVGRVSSLDAPGRFLVRDVGAESILFVRISQSTSGRLAATQDRREYRNYF